jgi:hypothetical protein
MTVCLCACRSSPFVEGAHGLSLAQNEDEYVPGRFAGRFLNQEATFNSAQTQTRAHLPSPFCPNQTVPRLSVLYFESVTYSAASPTCPATPNCPVHPPAPSIANHCKHDIYAIVIGVWIAPLKFYGRGSITQCWRPGRQPETIFGLFHDKRYANESQSLDRNGGRC